MSGVRVWTLSESAKLLGEPQHRLIHLCEKGAIVPEIGEARGRGSSRQFSSRNLLEFAVALKLRATTIQVAVVASVVRVLQQFERSVAKEIQGFSLPESLRTPAAPDLRIVISDGRYLFFTLGQGGRASKVFGGVNLTGRRKAKASRATPLRETSKPGAAGASGFGWPEGSRHVRVEVSVTQIAKDLPLEG